MRSVPSIAVIGALGMTLAACGSSGDSGGASDGEKLVDGKTFTLVLGADPGNLDPHFTSLSGTRQVDEFLYDSLISFDAKGGMLPSLAQSWKGDTTKVTYTLRKGITCSDGSPLTATDVAANISFVGDPKNASSRIGVFVPAGTTAKGDDAAGTVTVTSAAPDAFLERNIGGLHIVCASGMKDRSLLKQGAVGTGMFTMTEAVTGDHYTLTRRKDYAWGPGDWKVQQPGLPDTVVFKVVVNETTAANLLLSGAVNAVSLVGPDKRRLQAQKAQKLFKRDVVALLGELWYNHKPGMPGADEAVRRALTQALDLRQLGQVLTSGTGQPATGLVAPGLGPCPQNTIGNNLPAHDLKAAGAALDAAGWRIGADGMRAKAGQKLSMSFFYVTNLGPTMQAGAELVQQVWKSIGVGVTLKGVTDAEVGSLIVGGQGAWNATIVPLNVVLPTEAVPFLSGAVPPKGTNFSSIENPGYLENVKAASSIAGTEGCATWAAAEESLFKHVNVVPFVNSTNPTFGRGTRFELARGTIRPASIRMLG